MDPLRPQRLRPGDVVGIVSPSWYGPGIGHRVERGMAHLRSLGFEPKLGTHALNARGWVSDTAEHRVEDIHAMLRDPSVHAIVATIGGDHACHLLPLLDWELFRADPKILIGFSDITALHQAVALHARVATFHGPMLNLDFHAGLSQGREMWFWSALRGEAPMTYTFDSRDILTSGSAEGVLFGGCLSITAALIGTPYDYWVDDGIWFWEDVDESVYRIDRMLTHLRLSGRMKNIRGVVIGKLKGCGSEEEIDSLLLEFFGSSGIPIVRNFPFGHQGDNMLMPVGAHVRLDSSDNSFTITERLVR